MLCRDSLFCNCSGVSAAEAYSGLSVAMSTRLAESGVSAAGPWSPNSASETVRKLVLEVKAKTEENRICADCRRAGEPRHCTFIPPATTL